MPITENLPGLPSVGEIQAGGKIVSGSVDPTASGSEGAPTGQGGPARKSPEEYLAEKTGAPSGAPGSPPPKRGPGRPKGSKNKPLGAPAAPSGASSGDAGPQPPPGGSQPPPVDDFVPWKPEDFVGLWSGTFSTVGPLVYPDASQPWTDIAGGVDYDAKTGATKLIPPAPAILLISERTAAVCNKWRLRLVLKEEIQLAAALGGTVFACVMASEAIRQARRDAERGGPLPSGK